HFFEFRFKTTQISSRRSPAFGSRGRVSTLLVQVLTLSFRVTTKTSEHGNRLLDPVLSCAPHCLSSLGFSQRFRPRFFNLTTFLLRALQSSVTTRMCR